MNYQTSIECPVCGNDLTVAVSIDSNYGADADGNRGVNQVSTEMVNKPCACSLTDEELNAVGEQAMDLTLGNEDEEWDD